MKSYHIEKTAELKKEKDFLERELGVAIKISKNQASITGPPLKEYVADIVMQAIEFGFSVRSAIELKSEDMTFHILNIKDYTRRKNLREVKARLIGKHGQTKKTIQEISGCKMEIRGNQVAVLGEAEDMEYATIAISNLIKGAKQSNVYKYLERINTNKKQNKK